MEFPFTLEIQSIKRTESYSSPTVFFTAVDVMLENGSDFLNSITLQCEVYNPDGYQWQAEGEALSIAPNKSRKITLISYEVDKSLRQANRAICEVKGFSRNIVR